MKQLLTIIALFTTLAGYGQQRFFIGGNSTSFTISEGLLDAKKQFLVPRTKSVNRFYDSVNSFALVNDTLWRHTGTGGGWVAVNTGSGGGGGGATDTSHLSARIDQKLNISDSGAKYISPYAFDTAFAYLLGVTEYLRDRVDSNVHKVDSNIPGGYVSYNYFLDNLPTPFDSTHVYAALADTAQAIRASFPDIAPISAALAQRVRYGDSNTVYVTQYGADTAKTAIRGQIPTNTNQLVNGANFITGNQPISVTGDATGAGTTTIPLTLKTVNNNPGIYGSSAAIPVVAVNDKGLVTSVTTVSAAAATVVAAGTGITVGPPVGTTYTVTNSAPDQTVVMNEGYGVNINPSYPAFAIAADTLEVTSIPRTKKVIDSLGAILATKPTGQSWTIGSIPFSGATGTNTLTQDNSNLYWDNVNKRMAVGGTTSPTGRLHVIGATSNTPSIIIGQDIGSSVIHSGVFQISTTGTGGAGSLLMDLKTSTTSRFNVATNGWATAQVALSAPYLMPSVSGFATFNSSLKIAALTNNWSGANTDLISIFWDRGASGNQTSFTAGTGTNRACAWYPRVAQGGTAAMSDLYLNRVQVSTGSGAQYLMQLAVNSNDMWRVTNTGQSYQAGSLLIGSTIDDGTNALQVSGSATMNGITVNTGVSQGSGLKHRRVTTGAVTAGGTALVTVTWPSAFADGNYTVSAQVEDATASGNALHVVHIETKTATTLTVRVSNTAASDLTGTLHVVAYHD